MLGDVPLADIPLASIRSTFLSVVYSYLNTFLVNKKNGLNVNKEVINSLVSSLTKNVSLIFKISIIFLTLTIKVIENLITYLNIFDLSLQKNVKRAFNSSVLYSNELIKDISKSFIDIFGSGVNLLKDIYLNRNLINSFSSVLSKQIHIFKEIRLTYSVQHLINKLKELVFTYMMSSSVLIQKDVFLIKSSFLNVSSLIKKGVFSFFRRSHSYSVVISKEINRIYEVLLGLNTVNEILKNFVDFTKYFDLYISFKKERRFQRMIQKFKFFDKPDKFKVILDNVQRFKVLLK